MKIIISILSVAVVFLAIWNYSLSANYGDMKQYLVSHIENSGVEVEQAWQTESHNLEATIKLMADSTEKVWQELLEIKSKDIVWLGESIAENKRNQLTLIDRQDKIAKEQYDYFGNEILKLHKSLIETQEQIVRLHGTESW